MSNIRKNRWDDRANLKRDSNRRGKLDATHPQARRGIESQLDALGEASTNLDGSDLAEPHAATPPDDPANPELEQEIYDKVSPFPIIVDRVKALITQREAQADKQGYERGRHIAKQNIGMLRQWLNEERIKDGKYFVTNEELELWLEKGKPDVQ